MKSGVLCLKKEQGFTSHDAVAKIRRLYSTRKVGHTGTLDPQATGVLPILIGNAVKACDLIPEDTKVYCATVRFGLKTDTEDIWGQVIEENEIRPQQTAWEEALHSFVGESFQIPPMVSAVKVNGKKLYEYAREGITVEREPRKIMVYSLEALSFTEEEAVIRATVSRGTYIRTLLTDLCQKVGCLGTMTALEREKSGIFTLQNAVTLEEIEKMSPSEREACLLPTEQIFSPHPIFVLPPFFDRLIANGCRVDVKKIGLKGSLGQRFRLYRNGRFFALGELIENEGISTLCKIKDFPPDGATENE